MELRIVKGIALIALWLGITLGLRAQTVVEYVHTDALGTPVAITNAAGTVIERSEYAPYGELLNRPATDGPGFTGHVQDAATGLTYMQQRYYDPGIGKMLSVDPVTAYGSGDWRHFNVYAYAYNNPYKFTDPDGRCPACDRFGDAYAKDPGAFEAFEPAAVAVTIAAVALTPIVGPYAAAYLRNAARNADEQPKTTQKPGDLHAPGDVPDGQVIVRGGTGEAPTPGEVVSGSQGGTVGEAAKGVPHGTIRTSTAGEIRAGGGEVRVAPEPTRSGQMNGQHVDVKVGDGSNFGAPQPNPVPKPERIQ